MNDHNRIRILSFDARRSRFGYALFEGRTTLLDWGTGAVQPGNGERFAFATMHRRIGKILDLCAPAVIAVRRIGRAKDGGGVDESRILKAILREGAARQIAVTLISAGEVRDAFRVFHLSTKHQIADLLVQMYPELRIRLPHKRRAWQSESRATVIFDAAATGLAYWHREGAGIAAPQQCEHDAFPPAPHQLA